MLWTRWALRRLGHLLFGMPTSLVNDLDQGAIFYSGLLSARLEAAGLDRLTEPDQRRIGLAVAQRAMRGTVLAAREGVRACANSDDLTRWPAAYRWGVVDGLVFDRYGHLHLDERAADWVPRILGPVPEPGEVLAYLREKVETAIYSSSWLRRDWATRQTVHQ